MTRQVSALAYYWERLGVMARHVYLNRPQFADGEENISAIQNVWMEQCKLQLHYKAVWFNSTSFKFCGTQNLLDDRPLQGWINDFSSFCIKVFLA